MPYIMDNGWRIWVSKIDILLRENKITKTEHHRRKRIEQLTRKFKTACRSADIYFKIGNKYEKKAALLRGMIGTMERTIIPGFDQLRLAGSGGTLTLYIHKRRDKHQIALLSRVNEGNRRYHWEWRWLTDEVSAATSTPIAEWASWKLCQMKTKDKAVREVANIIKNAGLIKR